MTLPTDPTPQPVLPLGYARADEFSPVICAVAWLATAYYGVDMGQFVLSTALSVVVGSFPFLAAGTLSMVAIFARVPVTIALLIVSLRLLVGRKKMIGSLYWLSWVYAGLTVALGAYWLVFTYTNAGFYRRGGIATDLGMIAIGFGRSVLEAVVPVVIAILLRPLRRAAGEG